MGSATHEQITGTAAKIESSPHPRQAAKDALGLRALFVLNSLDVGGSETKTVRLVNSMLNRGVTAGIAYLNDSDALREQLSADAPLWPLHRRGKFSIAAVRSIRRIVAQHAPDVVFSVNMYPALYVALATAGHRRRPLVVALLNTTALEARDEWRRTFYRPFLRRFDQIVFGCQLQRKEWSAHLRLQDANSSVIYNGIDVDRFAALVLERSRRRAK